MKVNHIQLVLHQAKMQPLSLSVIFLSLVALGHQNYVKIYNPLNNWFEDGYLFQFGDGNEQVTQFVDSFSCHATLILN